MGSDERWKAWAERNPEKAAARIRAWRQRNPRHMLWVSAKRRAKERGIEFDILPEDIPEIPEICPIALIKLEGRQDGKRGPWDYSPTLDRIDTERGYTKDNIRVISHRGNRWKSDLKIDDVERLLQYMKGEI